MDREERADKDIVEGRFKEFSCTEDLINELKGSGIRPCNNLGCSTCLCDCIWKVR